MKKLLIFFFIIFLAPMQANALTLKSSVEYTAEKVRIAISYKRQGKLAAIHLAIYVNELFLFDKNKKLIGYWPNNQFYNEKGENDGNRHL